MKESIELSAAKSVAGLCTCVTQPVYGSVDKVSVVVLLRFASLFVLVLVPDVLFAFFVVQSRLV